MVEAYNGTMTPVARSLRGAPRPTPDYASRGYWQGTIKMSLSKFFVLRVLHQRPMHGYEVVQAVEKTTRGCCSPTEGTIYPMLNDFEANGLLAARLETVQGRERKVYALTRRGRDAFRVAVQAWLEATDCILASRAASQAPHPDGPDGCC
ncbi:PadR family transcriptional regulator [Luteimonas sp. RD2P54]|uniref:PadR family transcriptional regulator n=1 Tax=Luteimonas endophytica TaxID=3042023 RepID=A0ABT6J8Z0_9GAMM|nr:PadR family transcriptional regulator [Luteimonas endophytica]MDH5823290.1 PadR family transcriptional regulator [Luteimonas endophytica]